MKRGRQRWQDSYIVRFFVYITNLVYSAIEVGLLGRLFTSYQTSDRLFRTSLFGRAAKAIRIGNSRVYRTVRRNVALAMNRSWLNRFFSGLIYRFCCYSMRTFGAFCVTAGAYSAIMYWLLSVVWQSNSVETSQLFGAASLLVIGILMLFSDTSLGYAISHGLFYNKLLAPLFGVPEETLRTIEKEGKQGYAIAIPLGMVIGAVTALTSPFYLLAGLIAFLLIYLVLSVPEAGVVLVLLVLPFVGFWQNGERWLLFAAALPMISYLGKLLRGKRAFHLEVQDVPVLLMLLFFLLSGISVAGRSAWSVVLPAVLLVGFYFLVVNVIATPSWSRRCRQALVVSAMLSSLVGIVQYLLAVLQTGVLTLSVHSASVHAGFADQTTFAYFLVIAFPFALITFATSTHTDRIWSGFALAAIVAVGVLTWVHSAMISMIVMLLLFLLLFERFSFPFILVGTSLFTTVIATLSAPNKERFLGALRSNSGVAVSRTLSAGDLVGRIFFEKGSGLFARGAGISRLFFGLGSGGIERFCALYTSVPPQEVAASLNFWFYLLIENGVAGVLLPIAFFFLFYQSCFSTMRYGTDRTVRLCSMAGVVMLTGVLIMSIFRYAWYDPAALLVFFAAAAVISAAERHERFRRVTGEFMEDGNRAELEYYG
ncbi:MAG: hypothetical protein E7590_02045 [Ruminococcaceae bacterium]|nr:hypothetical protein [Oscillospiraceae bacterium]